MNEVVTAAWDKVVEDWDAPTRHDALFQLAVEQNAFKWVATRYRERKGDPIADAQLARIANAAMATMLSSAAAQRTKESASPYKRALMWIAVLVMMLLFGLIATKLTLSGHHAERP